MVTGPQHAGTQRPSLAQSAHPAAWVVHTGSRLVSCSYAGGWRDEGLRQLVAGNINARGGRSQCSLQQGGGGGVSSVAKPAALAYIAGHWEPQLLPVSPCSWEPQLFFLVPSHPYNTPAVPVPGSGKTKAEPSHRAFQGWGRRSFTPVFLSPPGKLFLAGNFLLTLSSAGGAACGRG